MARRALKAVDAQAYCEERIGRSGPSLTLALGFVAPASRASLTAVHALEAELRDVGEHSSDAGVGRARAAWWASELVAARAGNPGHPATVALARSLPPDTLRHLGLAAMLDAVAAMAARGPGAAERPIEHYARALGAVTGALGAVACGWPAPGPPPWAGRLAAARIRLELAGHTHAPADALATARSAARAARDAVPATARAAVLDQLILTDLALAGPPGAGRTGRALAALRGPWIAWRTALRARRSGSA